MVIDFSFLTSIISDLNFFFTNLARSEQMKDVDMRSKTSKRAVDTDEDIASTNVHCYYKDGSVSFEIDTNDNNTDSVWKNNFYTMARTLIVSKVTELISVYKDLIADQIKPYFYEMLGGEFA